MLTKSNNLIDKALTSGDYCVDEMGNVYKKTKKGLRQVVPQLHKAYGRYRIRLYGDKVYHHRLVAYSKFGRDMLLTGVEVHHIDGNPLNNHPDNLSLVPAGFHLSKYHSGENNHSAKLTWREIRIMRQMWKQGDYTYSDLSRIFGLAPINVKKVILGQSWREENDPQRSKGT